MTNNGWVATAKIFTIIPMLFGGFYLFVLIQAYVVILDMVGKLQYYNYLSLIVRFVANALIGILLLVGPFLFMLGKKSGWILSVSSSLATVFMAANSFITGNRKEAEWTFIAILIGILIGLYFVCLFTSDVRNTFSIKKRELLITGIITLTCITVKYLY